MPAGLFWITHPAVEKGEYEGLKENIKRIHLGNDRLRPHALPEGEEETACDAGCRAEKRLCRGSSD